MEKWETKKYLIDMDYQQLLQEYQVLLASKWAIPIAVFTTFIQMGFKPDDAFLWGGLFAYGIYCWFDNNRFQIKRPKQQVQIKR